VAHVAVEEECLRRCLFFSEDQLRRTVTVFVGYYDEARPHQGIANIPDVVAGRLPARQVDPAAGGQLVARSILGGLAHDYSLAA
jgi:hypothetical protein